MILFKAAPTWSNFGILAKFAEYRKGMGWGGIKSILYHCVCPFPFPSFLFVWLCLCFCNTDVYVKFCCIFWFALKELCQPCQKVLLVTGVLCQYVGSEEKYVF